MSPRLEGYTDLAPLPDGRSYEVFGARDPSGREVVVRVYGAGVRSRGPEAPSVQAGVLRLLRGLVPVPDVLEVRPDLLVTTRLPGVALGPVLESADDQAQRRWGRLVGEVAGRLATMPFSGPGGFQDDRLRVGMWEEGSESLLTWLDRYLPGSALEELTARQLATLRAFCAEGDDLLAVSLRAVLVHGDFTPRNLLCDPATGELTGVIDWEFTHAGHPLEDLGKLVRRSTATPFVRAAVEELSTWLPSAERAGVAELTTRARAADLYSLIEAASRRGASASTVYAWQLLDRITDTGDLLTSL